jgi:hypothetical protein
MPPATRLSKSHLVLSWWNYTTPLELILAKISEFDERLRAAAKRRLRLKQNFLPPFLICARPFSFSIKVEENFVSAFCLCQADENTP